MMHRQRHNVWIFLIAITCLSPLFPAGGKETFSLYWENDGTFLKPNDRTDRHYTNGLKLVYTHQPGWSWLRDFGTWNNFSEKAGDDVSMAAGYFAGHNIYTPDHVGNADERQRKDRVFAGWLYGGVFAQRGTSEKMEHFELNAGVIGPSAHGEDTQKFVHDVVGADEPNGWGKQLKDEFAFDFTWFTRQRADAVTFAHTSSFDSHIEYGFTAGSVHRNAVLSILFRAGFNVPDNFGPGRLEAPAYAIGGERDESTHFYIFSRFGGRAVEYDRFLTGLREKPLVGIIQVGGTFRHKSFEINYSQTFFTREYDEQHDGNSFASLTLSYRF